MNDIELTAEERAVYGRLAAFAVGKPFILNPDMKLVRGIIKGLLKRTAQTGLATCPCRLPSKDAAKDAAIVCPCVQHEEEIRTQGHCHCMLYIAKPS